MGRRAEQRLLQSQHVLSELLVKKKQLQQPQQPWSWAPPNTTT